MTALAAVPVRLTVEEFLAWAPGTNDRWQLVDGVPHAMAPASRTHGAMQSELGGLIRNHLRTARPACSVIIAPGVVPRALSDHNMRAPELAVTCSAYDREEASLSDPVLIVEILSPSNQAATWTNVWAYISIPSVREILVLRSDRIGASLLRRHTDGSWPQRPTDLSGGQLVLECIGLTVPLADVYATTRLRQS